LAEPDPVAALAAQLEQLRGQLARTQGEVGYLKARLKEDSGQVPMFRLQVKQLRERLEEAVGQRLLKPPPAPWWGVDQEQGEAMLADLRGWVGGWLARHYPGYVTRLPSCWWRHMEAVWELSALRTEHERIFADPENGDQQGLLAFHDRWFPGVLARLAAALADCKNGPCQLISRSSS
jgi:hypothetical protein